MNSNNSPSKVDSVLRFLFAEELTDLRIRARSHEFKVHKTIIAASSKYFEQIFRTRVKQEDGNEGFVELDEEPSLVAALILGLYTGSYSDSTAVELILKNAQPVTVSTQTLCSHELSLPRYVLDATMFAIAESYGCPTVLSHATTCFVTALGYPTFSLNSLIKTLTVLYKDRPTADDTLRVKAVYWARRNQDDLVNIPQFKELIDTTPTFAWDFGVRYGKLHLVQCLNCRCDLSIKFCNCGFRGMCGNANCSQGDMKILTCGQCGSTGHIVREKPKAVDNRRENADVASASNEGICGKGTKPMRNSIVTVGEAFIKDANKKRKTSA